MYFKNFPNTETLVKDNIVNVKNILRQAVFTNESIEKDRAYTTYKMKDSDTLESIALDLYGREDLSWLLMMFNEMIDPMYDSSLNTISMDNFINKKYDGQSIFITERGSSSPFSVTYDEIKNGDLVMRREGDTGNVSYDENNYAFVKHYDKNLSKIQLYEQVGTFKKSDDIAIVRNDTEILNANIARVDEIGRSSLHHFGLGVTTPHLDPLGSIPDLNGYQLSLGVTSSTTDSLENTTLFSDTLLYKYLYESSGQVIGANALSASTGDNDSCSFDFVDFFGGVSSLKVGSTSASYTFTGLGATQGSIIFKFKPLENFEVGGQVTYDGFPSDGVITRRDEYHTSNMRRVLSTKDWGVYSNGSKLMIASTPENDTSPSNGDTKIQANGYLFAPTGRTGSQGNVGDDTYVYNLQDGKFSTIIISYDQNSNILFSVDARSPVGVTAIYHASISGEFIRDGEMVFGKNANGKSLIVSGTMENGAGETMNVPQYSSGVTDESLLFLVDSLGFSSGTLDLSDYDTRSKLFAKYRTIEIGVTGANASNTQLFEYAEPTSLISTNTSVNQYRVLNSDYEIVKNMTSGTLKLPNPSIVSQVELEMRKLLSDV